MSRSFVGLLLGAFLISSPASAGEPCKTPGNPEANIALVKGFYAAFNTGDKSLFDGVLAKDWVDVPLAPGQGPGREGMKGALDGFKAAFPDLAAKNEDFIAAGDKVVVRSTITGTQDGDFASVRASHRKIMIGATDIHQICDGKVVTTWHVEDWLTALFEIGALPLK